MVPDWGLRGGGLLRCHISTSNVIISLYAKCQISIMIITLSKIPDLLWDFKDIEGSWPETLRMGTSLTSHIILVDDYETSLKV